jgi:hypothetical protein
MKRHISVFGALFVMAPFVGSQARAPACIGLSVPDAKTTVTGKLSVQSFAGPPNYESIDNGDAEESALILELPRRMCASDGEFIDGMTAFDRVHVSSDVPALLNVLNAAKGRRVTIRGEAFGAHTGHHRARLVLFAEEVTVH